MEDEFGINGILYLFLVLESFHCLMILVTQFYNVTHMVIVTVYTISGYEFCGE